MDKTSTFYCDGHKAEVTVKHSDFTTGYGKDNEGHVFCFECCGKQDKERMERGEAISLYLTLQPISLGAKISGPPYKLTNWPNTLSIPIYGVRKGKHNIARTRYDFWFSFAGHSWHGVRYGENTQIAHCRPVRKAA